MGVSPMATAPRRIERSSLQNIQASIAELLRTFPIRILRRPLIFTDPCQAEGVPDRAIKIARAEDRTVQFEDIVAPAFVADHAGHVVLAFDDALLADVIAAAVRCHAE